MKEAILKRFPSLSPEDIQLQDDGDGRGIYISYWNSTVSMPTIEEVEQWAAEDAKKPKPLTIEERIAELENIQNLQLMGVL